VRYAITHMCMLHGGAGGAAASAHPPCTHARSTCEACLLTVLHELVNGLLEVLPVPHPLLDRPLAQLRHHVLSPSQQQARVAQLRASAAVAAAMQLRLAAMLSSGMGACRRMRVKSLHRCGTKQHCWFDLRHSPQLMATQTSQAGRAQNSTTAPPAPLDHRRRVTGRCCMTSHDLGLVSV
jgi:hypothetical protein